MMQETLEVTLNKLWKRDIFPQTSIIVSDIEKAKITVEKFLANICSNYTKVPLENNSDIIFLKLEKQKTGDLSKSISINDVRKLQEEFANSPLITPFRFGIIIGAEHLNQNSANSLLKILEDSPKGAYFILISEDINKIIPTIKSRSIEIYNHRDDEDIPLDMIDLVCKILNPEVRFSDKIDDIAKLDKLFEASGANLAKKIIEILGIILLNKREYNSKEYEEFRSYNSELKKNHQILSFLEESINLINGIKQYNLDSRQVILTIIAKYSCIE
jgi:DNA polymerase III delta prime subunit